MKSAQILPIIENNDLPVRIVGTGNVTHVFVGTLFDGKNSSEVVCLFAQPAVKATPEFEKILKSECCRCEHQKRTGFPLCGLCFSNLKKGVQTALRENRDAELEETYNLAVLYLSGRKR